MVWWFVHNELGGILKAAVVVQLEISQHFPGRTKTAFPISGPSIEPRSSRIRHKSPVRSQPISIPRCSFDDQITTNCSVRGCTGVECGSFVYKRHCNVPAGSVICQFPLWLFIRFKKGPESVFSRVCKTTGEYRQEYISAEIDSHWVLCSPLNNSIFRLSICDSLLNLTFPRTVASSAGVLWLIFDNNFSYLRWRSWFLNSSSSSRRWTFFNCW